MELLSNKKTEVPKLFLLSGLVLLAGGMAFGLVAGLQYLVPGLFKVNLSFERVRPLHVSSVVFWILMGASGAVLTYLQQHGSKKIYSTLLIKIQWLLFIISILAILGSYVLGKFGGREYWEFPPILALPITIGWILFIINFIKSIGSFRNQPVYVWMWTTGIFFFLFTYLESYLWLFPYFRNNVINDMTIQWKSYGSMVGSWNMLIYGCGIFLIDKISNSQQYSRSRIAFALYFLGLFNLMFNWGHHIYTLPTYPWVKHIGYIVSMTELIIIGRIIYQWKSTLSAAQKYSHSMSYRLLAAADIWIFLTLLLAILMSVPAINVYTHGTHITVAHTMGATIGVNSFLLLAFVYDILKESCTTVISYRKWFSWGYWLTNVSLLVFWVSLIVAGVIKSIWQMSDQRVLFAEMMTKTRPVFMVFVVSGALLMAGILMMIVPVVVNQVACYFKNTSGNGNKEAVYEPEKLVLD